MGKKHDAFEDGKSYFIEVTARYTSENKRFYGIVYYRCKDEYTLILRGSKFAVDETKSCDKKAHISREQLIKIGKLDPNMVLTEHIRVDNLNLAAGAISGIGGDPFRHSRILSKNEWSKEEIVRGLLSEVPEIEAEMSKSGGTVENITDNIKEHKEYSEKMSDSQLLDITEQALVSGKKIRIRDKDKNFFDSYIEKRGSSYIILAGSRINDCSAGYYNVTVEELRELGQIKKSLKAGTYVLLMDYARSDLVSAIRNITFRREVEPFIDFSYDSNLDTKDDTGLLENHLGTFDSPVQSVINKEDSDGASDLDMGTIQKVDGAKDAVAGAFKTAFVASAEKVDTVEDVPVNEEKSIDKEGATPDVPRSLGSVLDEAFQIMKREVKEEIQSTQSSKNVTVDISSGSIRDIARVLNTVLNKSDSSSSDDAVDDWGDDKDIPVSCIPMIGTSEEELYNLLQTPKGAVLIAGVPGTGKSTLMFNFISKYNIDEYHHVKITFHQDYSYTDFIGGVVATHNGFVYKDGIFTQMCKRAIHHRDEKFYILIDEFSRGNTEEILGEAITAMCFRDKKFMLACGKQLIVPSNLYIIASMNITDASTKEIDFATSQRFEHLNLEPQWSDTYMKKLAHGDDGLYSGLSDLASYMRDINKAISEDPALGRTWTIGTRDVTVENMTIDTFYSIVEHSLVPSISKIAGMHGSKSADEIATGLANIKKLLVGDK